MSDRNNNVDIRLLAKDIVYIKKAVDSLRDEVKSNYITRLEFDYAKKDIRQLQLVVFTVIGTVSVGVLGLILRNAIPNFQ